MAKRKKENNPSKPAPDERARVYSYNEGKQYDIETRKNQNLGHITLYKRINGNKMLNEQTGEEVDIKKREKRLSRAVYSILKTLYRLLKENFKGNESEKIIRVESNETVTEKEVLRRKIKSCKEKLLRIINGIEFIRVLVYQEANKPIIDFWVKKTNGTKLELNQEELQNIWSGGTITIRKITLAGLDYLARYYNNNSTDINIYPTGIKVYSISENIKPVVPKEMEYKDAEKLVVGYKTTYRGAISIIETIEDKDEEIQHITYESFKLEETKRKIKSCKTTKPVKAKGNFAKRFKEQAEQNYKIIKELAENPKCWVTVTRLNIDWYETTSKGKKKVPTRRNAEETIMFLEAVNERIK